MKLKEIGFKKLIIGFILIILVALISAVTSSLIINKNKETIVHINNEVYPFMDKLNKFEQVVLNSKMLITNWVYLQYNIDDKKELELLHKTVYPEIKTEILNSLEKAGHKDNLDSLNLIFNKMDSLMKIETEIMQTLVDFNDYEDPEKIFTTEEIIDEQILPLSSEIKILLQNFIFHTKEENDEQRNEMLKSMGRLELTAIIFGFGMFIIILFSVFYIQKTITIPVLTMRDVLNKLSKGEIVEQSINNVDDVIKQMADALKKLSDNFNQTSSTAHKIGKGDFNTEIQLLSNNDILGHSLIEMKNSLKEYSEDMENKVRERTAEISKQKSIIEVKNKDITASITYAERIQKANLPDFTIIKNELPNSFILFKPRDIVSGDFYWFAKNKNKIIISAVDCTGHGVPGAFMSLIGMNILATIVNEKNIVNAGLILDELHKHIQLALKQDTGENKDGMDLALCVLDKTEKTIEFAGAKNPLIYIQNSNLEHLRGDHKGIGGIHIVEEKYESHLINIEQPTCFYIFTDGFEDQFGGEKGRKFMIKNLKEMLLKNHKLPMIEQKQIYENTLNNWMNGNHQIDDILLIGFEI